MNDDSDRRLINGSTPLLPEQLLARLNAAGIEYRTRKHAPMRTVEDAKAIRQPSDYGHTKNLFVRNRKGQMWMLTLHEDRRIDLKETAGLIGANRFSFASTERMMQYLGVTPGAVSPFALVNDITNQVRFYIDETLMEHPFLHLHPLDNTLTTTIERDDLLGFLAATGHSHTVLPV